MDETPRDSLTAQMMSCAATLVAVVVGLAVGRLLVPLETEGEKESTESNEFNESTDIVKRNSHGRDGVDGEIDRADKISVEIFLLVKISLLPPIDPKINNHGDPLSSPQQAPEARSG